MAMVDRVLPSRRQVEARLALAAGGCAVLAALLIPRLAGLSAPLSDQRISAWWLLPAFLGTEMLLVRLRLRGRLVFLSMSTVPLVVGMFLASPLGLAVVVTVALAIAGLWQRERPALLAANAFANAAALPVAVFAFHALVDIGDPFGLTSWLAVVAAAVIVALGGFALNVYLAWLRGDAVAEGVKDLLGLAASAEVVNATIAFLALRLLVIDLRMAWLIGGLVGVLTLAYRNYAGLLSNHESLERLYHSTREIERPRDHRTSVQSLLDQTLELLGADTAELTFLPTDEHPPMVIVCGRDRRFDEMPPDVAARMAAERAAELAGESPEAAAAPAPDESFAGFDETAAAQLERQILTAPLQGPNGIVGTLRVSMNWGGSFGNADRQLLEMFANHASVALHNSKLIDQLRAEVAEREHQALHDRLTALPNRVMFDLQTRQALDHRGEGELVAVMLADLDRFKEVNDTLGHDHGDELLEVLANRIAALADDERYTVARLGGDEFSILVRGLTSEDEVERIARHVRELLELPVEIAGVSVDVGASIGVAIAPRDGADATTLLQRADVAMYVAKAEHRGVNTYAPDADPYSPKRLSLAADLRQAVEAGQVEPHFQPITSLSSGRPTAVEALARWTHPTYGVVPPDVFIPIAEQSGLIRELTFAILDRSLEQVRAWKSAGFELMVGVNLSVRCLDDEHLVERIARHLERAGVAPSSLKLEVTEGTIMADPMRAIAVLEELHQLGVSLSIDDFGMGYSSLNQLKRMPVSQLKVDRSFVSGLPHDRDDVVIVRSVIELGHNLGMEVVAEGVEDREGLEFLRSLGCDAVQGYYLSPPLPAPELLRWMRRRPQISRPVVTAAR